MSRKYLVIARERYQKRVHPSRYLGGDITNVE